MDHVDKVAVITGAARGIGLACAQRLAAEGAAVVLADINAEAARDAARELARRGARTWAHPCDVGVKEDVDRLVDTTLQTFGRIDILVANAAVTSAGSLVDVAEQDWSRVLRTNLTGVFLCGQAVARAMIGQGRGGAIVNMSSVAAELAMPTQMAYAATKGAVRQLTKAMALSLAPHGIRVNAVGPGTVDTEMITELLDAEPQLRADMLARTPMGRFARPEEIASVVNFLASQDASYVTGQTIYVDGGRLSLNFTIPAAGLEDVDQEPESFRT